MKTNNSHTWLAALPVALAFNAKQSAAVLIIPTLIAIAWQSGFRFQFLK